MSGGGCVWGGKSGIARSAEQGDLGQHATCRLEHRRQLHLKARRRGIKPLLHRVSDVLGANTSISRCR